MTTLTTPKPEIPRDRWTRPLIIPPEGGPAQAYTRVSTMAKVLDKQDGLMLWGKRKVMEGALRRPDLLTRTAGILANGNPDEDDEAKKRLNKVCDEAAEAAGASRGASSGTGFHHLTEAIDKGVEPEFVPPADAVRLDAYRTATAGIEWLDIECFVVNDTVRAAGTFDRLGRLPDGRVVVMDLKSGKSEADYPLATTTQIAIYANGLRYDPETGERTPLHDDLDPKSGVLIHLPPTGGCALYELRLEHGWRAAQLAMSVREVRSWKSGDLARWLA